MSAHFVSLTLHDFFVWLSLCNWLINQVVIVSTLAIKRLTSTSEDIASTVERSELQTRIATTESVFLRVQMRKLTALILPFAYLGALP